MRKENFDTPQWQEYFKGKSPGEIEEIKKLFEEKKEINGRPVTGLKDLFKSKNKLEGEKLNETTLSTGKQKKVYEEEKTRIEAKKKLEAEQNNKKFGLGCAGFIGLIILIIIGIAIINNPTAYWQNLEQSSKIDNSQVIKYSLTQTEDEHVYPLGRAGVKANISLYPSDAQAKATLFKIIKEFSLSHPKADEINVWLNLWSDYYKMDIPLYRAEWKERKINFENQFYLYK